MTSHRHAPNRWSVAARVLAACAILFSMAGCSPKEPVKSGNAAKAAEMPRIVRKGDRYALMVDGAPYLLLGMQANNSSNYPAALPKVWKGLQMIGANTLEIPVSWEQLEPVEGQFDYSYVDTLLAQARQHKVRLVLLWFGTWKNTNPNYTPAWVKLNNDRFPRMLDPKGKKVYALSPHYAATLDADRKAFTVLMRHLQAVDPQRTVIMVQVENETGTYGYARDYAPVAQKLFDGPVPDRLVAGLHAKPGSWKQLFGANADESFHAWYISTYVEQVAAAGKAVYPLPMYVNAALPDPVKRQPPETYSSGGPTWTVLDIWKTGAPSIALAAPDIYGHTYENIMGQINRYDRKDNPLMIVEIGSEKLFARFFFPVLGRHGLGFAPFGFDFTGYSNYPLGAKKVDAEAIEPFARNFRILAPMAREWAKISFEKNVWGTAEGDDQQPQQLNLGRWTATVAYGQWQFSELHNADKGTGRPPGTESPSGGALIAELGPDEYLVIGQRARVVFSLTDKNSPQQSLFGRVEEGHYENGKWVFERVWNGDQTDYGLNFTTLPEVLRVKLATY